MDTFTINFSNGCISLPKISIISISPIVRILLISDPIADSINIITKSPPVDLNILTSLLTLKTESNNISITPNNFLFFYEVAIHLGIRFLIQDIHYFIPENLISPHVIEFLALTAEHNIDVPELYYIVSNNIGAYINPSFFRLPIQMLCCIFNSFFQNIHTDPKTKGYVLNCISRIVDMTKQPNHPLIQYLPFEDLSLEETNQFISNPNLNLNTISNILIDSLRFNLPKTFHPSRVPFSGVLHSPFCPEITVTDQFDSKHGIPQLLSENREEYYCSKSDNGKITIDFKKCGYKFKPTHFEIRSWKYGINGVCPKVFNLIGDSKVLNEQTDCRVMQTNYGHSWFSIRNDVFCDQVIFEQKDTFNIGNKRLALSGFDLYGVLQKV